MERYRQDARDYGNPGNRDPKIQNRLLLSERFRFDNSIVVTCLRMTPFKFKARYDLIFVQWADRRGLVSKLGFLERAPQTRVIGFFAARRAVPNPFGEVSMDDLLKL